MALLLGTWQVLRNLQRRGNSLRRQIPPWENMELLPAARLMLLAHCSAREGAILDTAVPVGIDGCPVSGRFLVSVLRVLGV